MTLELGNLRPDGFHEVRTYLVKLDWGDTVRIGTERGGGGGKASVPATVEERIRFAVRGASAPRGRQNLVVRALVRWLREDPDLRTVQVELRKRIPAGTGLGGGSSDAGTVLRVLRAGRERHAGGSFGGPQVAWAEDLGADVPFFLADSAGAIAAGRGGEITPGPGLPAGWPVVLVFPPMALETPRVYRRAGETRAEKGFGSRTARVAELLAKTRATADGDGDTATDGARVLDELAYLTGSDLSVAAFSLAPDLRGVWDVLVRALPGHRPCGMTGSGSALYAILGCADEAVRVVGALRRAGLSTRTVRSAQDDRPSARGRGLIP